jgi:hypothetical protein
MTMTKSCCNCSRITTIQKYYTKFITDVNDFELLCDTCYNDKQKFDNDLIQASIQMKSNIKELVKPHFLVNFLIPLKIHKEINEVIDDINYTYVVIEKQSYNEFMKKVAYSNDKLVSDNYISKIVKKQERETSAELTRVSGIEEKQRREDEEEQERERKKIKQIEIDRHNNDKTKKQKQEFIEERKTDLKKDGSTIKPCPFCKEYKIYPQDYKDENDNIYLKEYTINKNKTKGYCCVDCYFKTKDKKEDYIKDHQEQCPICNTIYMIRCENDRENHLNTNKCLRARDYKYDNKKRELSLMKMSELIMICRNTVNADGIYRIPNYTRMKKDDLLKKMIAIYDLLVIS